MPNAALHLLFLLRSRKNIKSADIPTSQSAVNHVELPENPGWVAADSAVAAAVAEDHLAAAVAEEASADLAKCSLQLAQLAVKRLKFLSNHAETNQYTAAIATLVVQVDNSQ